MTKQVYGMEKISILGKESILVGTGLTEYIVQDLSQCFNVSNYVIITDENIAPLYLQLFYKSLMNKVHDKSRVLKYIIKSGEESKSRETKKEIEEYLFKNHVTRDTILIALGGGVIGDLVGFIASTYMRGIPVIQIPTSLLAMVDSSIGGKTGIDTPDGGKNLIGAFHQPVRIYVDLSYLTTLPAREIINGFAEIIKTAAISSVDSFSQLENSIEVMENLINASNTFTDNQLLLLQSFVISSIKFKAYVVTNDEKESGLRSLLNFGHSIGHAIEAIYSPHLLHGECVAIGMILETEIARSMGICKQVSLSRLTSVIKAYGLPTSIHDQAVIKLLGDRIIKQGLGGLILEKMRIDKKNIGNVKRIVLLKTIGQTNNQGCDDVDDNLLLRVLCDSIRFEPKITNILRLEPEFNDNGLVTPKEDFMDSSPSTPSGLQYENLASNTTKNDNIKIISVPGSKSISNRALLLASLSTGTCKLKGLLHSDDTKVMLNALKILFDIKYNWEDEGDTLIIKGNDGMASKMNNISDIYLGNAGTAARFLTSVCAFYQLLNDHDKPITITGNNRMKVRPIGPLVDGLNQIGCNIKYLEKDGCLPLEFLPTKLSNADGYIRLSASISSQYVSSLLIMAPFYTKGLILDLQSESVISKPYIEMTIKMMAVFGVQVRELELNKYCVQNGKYISPSEYLIEGDASSATYPLAYAAITGTAVKVSNLGYNSMQGDSQFSTTILTQMGCNVNQTSTTTLVQGPPIGQLSSLGKIDMELMTDAFLTLAVLACVAVKPSLNQSDTTNTEIIGISNQRVKECNRINAMVTELRKIGINAYELDTGIAIEPIPINELYNIFNNSNHEGVECYDDHRVAMSFSLLGSLLPGLVILDKRCIEKTYPNWWDDLASLGQNIIGYETDQMEIDINQIEVQEINDTSIILIGMRGVGKSSLGVQLAALLSYSFVDLDVLFESKYNCSILEVINMKGWNRFRELEYDLLIQTLVSNPKNTVISTGGGIVESDKSKRALVEFIIDGGMSIFLKRDIKSIIEDLDNNRKGHRPDYMMDIEQIYSSRFPNYKQCSNFEFDLSDDTINNNANKLINIITSVTDKVIKDNMNSNLLIIPSNCDEFKPSYFLSLTYPDLNPHRSLLKDITIGCGAVELRVDLLDIDWNLLDKDFYKISEFIEVQLKIINEELDCIPIIYTIRTVSQGGNFPDKCNEKRLIDLFATAVRFPVSFVDLQSDWSKEKVFKPINELIKISLNYTQTIISTHDLSGSFRSTLDNIKQYASRFEWINPTVIKIVSVATNRSQNIELLNSTLEYRQSTQSPHLIAINMGELGQLTRVLNSVLTPVTHPSMKMAAPGQLSVVQINNLLSTLNITPSREFYLFGKPISKSPSPTYHNSAFELLGLSHKFQLLESDDIDEIRSFVTRPDFGGASVTIPNKILAISMCQHLTEEARLIGAVNTLIPIAIKGMLNSISILGDNTDWIAIHDLIKPHLATHGNGKVLVLGSGGTARAALFALFRLGYKAVYVANRTAKKANELINEFAGLENWKLHYVDQLAQFRPSIVIDTLPAQAKVVTSELVQLWFPANVTGLIVQLAYSKYSNNGSHLQLNGKYGENVVVVSGVDVFLKQAEYQFIKWTNLPAPSHILNHRVRDFLKGLDH